MSNKPTAKTNAPLYANVYAEMVPLAREHGYALAVHGSMRRDFDVVAVPWVEKPSTPEVLVKAITDAFHFVGVDGPAEMHHGRLCWTLAWPGECFVDFSVMPMGDVSGFIENLIVCANDERESLRVDANAVTVLAEHYGLKRTAP